MDLVNFLERQGEKLIKSGPEKRLSSDHSIGMFAVIGGLAMLAHYYTLNGIKSKTVGDGQYGTARFATEDEIKKTYTLIPYEPQKWRRGKNLPKEQGLVVGCRTHTDSVTALVDTGDIHCLMIGAAGVGKTANFLYPNIEYSCASGMSFLCTDTKGDLQGGYGLVGKCLPSRWQSFIPEQEPALLARAGTAHDLWERDLLDYAESHDCL